jgi:hypothetical protein
VFIGGLSLLLLVGAGLFVRTLQNLLHLDPGFPREGVLVVDLDGQREGYEEARLTAFYGDLLDRARRVPGVASASISTHTPLNGWTWTEAVAPKGQPVPQQDNAVFVAAGPNFFATLRTPLLAGREFDARDRGVPNVAIVNQAFASRYFPGRSPLRQYVTAAVTKPPSDLQVVGVVKDSVWENLRATPRPTVYVSYFQRASGTDSLEIRAAGSISQIAAAIHKELQPSFPKTPLDVRPLTAQVEQTLVEERLMAKLAGGFGGLGKRGPLRIAGLQRGAAYERDRRPYGAGRATRRGGVDGGLAGARVGDRRHRGGTASRLAAFTQGPVDAVRIDGDRRRRHGGRRSVAGGSGFGGGISSGAPRRAGRPHDGVAARIISSELRSPRTS